MIPRLEIAACLMESAARARRFIVSRARDRSQETAAIARRSRERFPPLATRAALSLALAIACVFARPASPARAIPAFAHAYGLTCQTCHTVVPHLTTFGEAFEARGFSFPGLRPKRVLPVAVKINVAYTSDHDPTGLPKATLDEVELFVTGRIGSRANYFIEQYAVDGGRPGATRDAWVATRLTPSGARVPVAVELGQFTLPLPIDPESFRESLSHDAIFDQKIGANPFAFFDPKMGGQLRIGAGDRGTSVAFLALGGHDAGSGIAAHGIDTMIAAQHVLGPVTASAYRYAGTRPLARGLDRFSRLGYGLTYRTGPYQIDGILQTGFDANAGSDARAVRSSGGLVQLRDAFSPRFFGLLRIDGTNDRTNGFARDTVVLLGYRLRANDRLTIEDDITHAPTARHALGVQYTVAY